MNAEAADRGMTEFLSVKGVYCVRHGKAIPQYLTGGRILVGCEGSERALAYLAKRVGIRPFAYVSDYPHEADLPAARHEIEEIAGRGDLTADEKKSVLAGNAKNFFKL